MHGHHGCLCNASPRCLQDAPALSSEHSSQEVVLFPFGSSFAEKTGTRHSNDMTAISFHRQREKPENGKQHGIHKAPSSIRSAANFSPEHLEMADNRPIHSQYKKKRTVSQEHHVCQNHSSKVEENLRHCKIYYH